MKKKNKTDPVWNEEIDKRGHKEKIKISLTVPTPELKDLKAAFLEVIEKLKKLRGATGINPLEN